MLFRAVMLLLLVGSALCFAVYAFTADVRFKRYGVFILKWTLAAAFVFFAVLFVQQL